VFAVTAAIGLAACGDDPGQGSRSASGGNASPTPPKALQPAPGSPAFVAPASVPRSGSGPADPAAVRVIQRWLAAMRKGDIGGASRLWALPSTFQNAAPVQRLQTRRQIAAVNASLPCGAVGTRFSGAGPYTLVRFRLVERRGGTCGSGVGSTTGGAIRVSGGKIREWYRLYEPGETRPGPEPVHPGPYAA
jgi:hypothetical protein